MQFSTLASFAAMAFTAVNAMMVTSPTANSTVTKGTNIDVTWSTVDTDPSALGIYLVNFVQWPPVLVLLASTVDTFSGKATVKIPCSVSNDANWQINLVNSTAGQTNTYVIYSQSPKFSLVGNCVDSTSSASGASATNYNSTKAVQSPSIVSVTAAVYVFQTSCAAVQAATSTVTVMGTNTITVLGAASTVTVGAVTSTVTVGANCATTSAASASSARAVSSAVPAANTTTSAAAAVKTSNATVVSNSSATTVKYTGAASSLQVSGLVGLFAMVAALAI